jgi:hypothetical protein
MLFSSKPKGFFIDLGEKSAYVLRTSASSGAMQVEVLREFQPDDLRGLAAILVELQSRKSAGGYTQACVGVNSDQVFVRKSSLDVKKLKDPDYLTEFAITQFKLDPVINSIAVLNATDGRDHDQQRLNPEKDVVLCGLPISEVNKFQEDLLQRGVYPTRLELSSVASLGALIDYLKFTDSTKPTLVLELGSRQTQSYIVSSRGIEASRPISVGLDDMVPVVQKELGLKDEESARKLFFSNTFDFTGMGNSLCKRLLKELQSSMGFYEVQTGQSISQLVCTVLPAKLNWIEGVIASQIGVTILQPNLLPWLNKRGISVVDASIISALDARKFALCGLIVNFNSEINDPAV